MRIFFFLSFFVILSLASDFITKSEYAKKLYSNPRGIGCDKCHGKSGEGIVISRYKEKNKKAKELEKKELVSPRINNVDFNKFTKALKEPKSIMPRYFLTEEEIKILYEYVINLNKKDVNEK